MKPVSGMGSLHFLLTISPRTYLTVSHRKQLTQLQVNFGHLILIDDLTQPSIMPKSEDEQNKAKSDKIGQAIENVCFSYLPAIGAISHTVFAIHILDKSLIPR